MQPYIENNNVKNTKTSFASIFTQPVLTT